jgi:YD repeat-containing protein
VTTVLNATESAVQKYDYDSRQLLLRSQSAEGVVAEFEYNQQGHKIREANNLSLLAGAPTWTDAEGDTGRIDEQKWKYDYFGRVTDHNDLNGHDYNYGYVAGMQVSQYASAFATAQEADLNWWQAILAELYATGVDIETSALNRTTEYYASGLVKKISDASGTYLYEYDANGNRTMEESTAIDGRGTSVHVRTRVEYDSHNRVTRVTTYNFGTPAAGGQPAVAARYELDLSYSYDAMGNRRRVTSSSGYSGYVDTESGHGSVTTAPITVAEGAIRVTDATLDLRTFRSGSAGAFTIRMADVFQDPEGRLPTYAAVAAPGSTWPDWLVASYDAQSGNFTFLTVNASAANLNQTFTIQLRATDPSNGVVVTSNVSVKVVGTSGTGPVATDATVPTFNATTGQPLSLSLLASDYFRDSDVGEVLTLSVDTPLPAWMSVENDGDAVRLTGLPTADLHTLTLRATDSNNNTVIRTIRIQGVANAGPVANAVPLQYIDADGPMALDAPLQALFTDADPLTVTAKMQDGTQLPSWLLFQYEPGALPRVRLNGEVPAGLAVGTQFNVVFTAVDPSGLTASTTVTLQVGDPPPVTPGPTPAPLVNNFNAGNVTLHAGQSIVLPASYFSRDGENAPYDLRVAVWIEGSSGSPYYNQEIMYTEDAPHWELRSLPDTMLWDAETRTITATADTHNMVMTLVVAPNDLAFFKFTRGNYTNQMFQTFNLTVDQGLTGTPLNREDYWYTYDAENRVQVVNGRMIGGEILLRDDNMYDASYDGSDGYMVNASLDPSYMQNYDAAGRAIGRTHLDIDGDVLYQQSIYTQRGELAATFGDRRLDAFDGDATAYGAGIAQTYIYDTAGRLTSQDMYFDPTSQNSEDPLGYVRGGQKFWYDKDGQMTRQEDWGKAEGDTDPDLDLLSVTTQDYDSVGRLSSRIYDHFGWEQRPHNRGEDPPDAFRHTFAYTYERRDGYLEKSVTGTSNTEYYRETTSTSTYDAMGRRIAVQEHTPLPEDLGEMEDRIRFFAYDAGNGILLRREGTLDDNNVFDAGGTAYEKERNAHHYTYVNGQSVAHLTEGGDMDVTSGLTAFDTQSGAGTVVVQENDTLQRIAQRVYGNAGMWYVIAEANAIEGNDDLIAGTALRTPAVKTVANTADTFRPYDPSQVIGPTTPELPWIAPPPKAGCDPVIMIILIVVAVAATIATGGAALAAMGATSFATASLPVAMAAGALGGMAGSIASQVAGMALGVQSKFSFKSVLAGAITGAITGGIASGMNGSTVELLKAVKGVDGANALTGAAKALQYTKVAASAVMNASASYVGNKLAGVDGTTFSWKSIAASAVTNVASAAFSSATSGWNPKSDFGQIGKEFVGNMVGGVVSLHVRRALGFDDEVNYGAMAVDAFGNTLGSKLGYSILNGITADKDVPPTQSSTSVLGGGGDVQSGTVPGVPVAMRENPMPSGPTTLAPAERRVAATATNIQPAAANTAQAQVQSRPTTTSLEDAYQQFEFSHRVDEKTIELEPVNVVGYRDALVRAHWANQLDDLVRAGRAIYTQEAYNDPIRRSITAQLAPNNPTQAFLPSRAISPRVIATYGAPRSMPEPNYGQSRSAPLSTLDKIDVGLEATAQTLGVLEAYAASKPALQSFRINVAWSGTNTLYNSMIVYGGGRIPTAVAGPMISGVSIETNVSRYAAHGYMPWGRVATFGRYAGPAATFLSPVLEGGSYALREEPVSRADMGHLATNTGVAGASVGLAWWLGGPIGAAVGIAWTGADTWAQTQRYTPILGEYRGQELEGWHAAWVTMQEYDERMITGNMQRYGDNRSQAENRWMQQQVERQIEYDRMTHHRP